MKTLNRSMKTLLQVILLLGTLSTTLTTTTSAVVTQVRIRFEPGTPEHSAAVAEYQAIWSEDGPRIVAALEQATGLRFEETEIGAIVIEGPSASGFGARPMRMRASYPNSTKRATLIHELGHRLHGRLFRRSEEDHPYLFLYLYDVWADLYGSDFADREVAVEGRRRGLYDYESAWRDALSLSRAERKARWDSLRVARQRRNPDHLTDRAFLAVSVADLDSSTVWYQRVFDVNAVRERASPDGRATVRILGNDHLTVELIQYRDSQSLPALIGPDAHALSVRSIFKTGVFVRDAAGLHDRLVEMGVDTDRTVSVDEALRMRTFLIRDRDGNRIQVFEPCGRGC